MAKIAIIGAGLAGLTLGRRLQKSALATVFEKARGVGGRMATRYANAFEFDHGAPYFTAKNPRFQEFVESMVNQDIVAPWMAKVGVFQNGVLTECDAWTGVAPRYVGVPRMNSLCKALSQGLDVHLRTRIVRFERESRGYFLFDKDQKPFGPFEWIILALPSPQVASLASEYPSLVALCDTRHMTGRFTVMLGFKSAIQLGWDLAEIRNSPIAWILVNSSKPGRAEPFTLVITSTGSWAEECLEADPKWVMDNMIQMASDAIGQNLDTSTHSQLHRWRYADSQGMEHPSFFIDPNAKLGACGDWLIEGSVESAFLSATDLADAMLPILENR